MSESLTLLVPPSPANDPSAAAVPLEHLEARICELAGHLTAATCQFLILVGDFDARRGWESWDLPSCSAWLAWKCQLTPGTAREHVRVARALRELPVIRGEFAAGRLSFAKVRALTRIATPDTEQCLAEMADPMTGGQLERFVRAHRRVSHADDQSARAGRRVTWRVDDQDGSVAMTVRLPAAEGQVLVQALRAAAADLEHPHAGHDDAPGGAARGAAGSAAGPAGCGVSAETRGSQPGSGTGLAGAAGHVAGDGDVSAETPGSLPGPGIGAAGAGSRVAGSASGLPAGAGAGGDGVSAETPASPQPGSEQAASLADALTAIAADYLAGKITAADNPDIYQVIVHVGPEALTADHDPAAAGVSAETPGAAQPGTGTPATAPPADHAARVSAETSVGAGATDPEVACRPGCRYRQVGHPADPRRCHLEDGPALSAVTAQRIACTATVSWMLHDHDGTLLDIGRRHRKPTPALRRAVRERDRYRCAFPGCHSRRTDLHHIRHWARGGTTSFWNLICLCQAHHVIVHELGYLITRDDTGGGFTFTRPDGTGMPASPALPDLDSLDIADLHDAAIAPDTIQAAAGERMNLHLTIWAAFANARIARERKERAAAQ